MRSRPAAPMSRANFLSCNSRLTALTMPSILLVPLVIRFFVLNNFSECATSKRDRRNFIAHRRQQGSPQPFKRRRKQKHIQRGIHRFDVSDKSRKITACSTPSSLAKASSIDLDGPSPASNSRQPLYSVRNSTRARINKSCPLSGDKTPTEPNSGDSRATFASSETPATPHRMRARWGDCSRGFAGISTPS